jgi:2-dehydropantoate 2-reductase
MKVCIYGAGAIGGWIGVGLAQAGCRLNVVARGATLEALQREGLSVVRGDQRTRVAVHAVADPAELGVQDLVVIAVKAPALPAVAARIAPLLGPDTIVLTAMNGVPWCFLLGGFGRPLAGTQLGAVDPGGKIDAAIPADRTNGV